MTPPGWNGWLHHTVDTPPSEEDYQPASVGAAAHRQSDRHAGGDPAQGLDAAPRTAARPTPATMRPGARAAEPPRLRFRRPSPAERHRMIASAAAPSSRVHSAPRRVAGARPSALSDLRGVAPPAHADKISHPTAVFDGLDKITGRIILVRSGDQRDRAVRHAADHARASAIRVRRPKRRRPTSSPRSTRSMRRRRTKRIFSGWMFADSPGLHGVEHPIYDIWLTDCKGGTTVIHEAPTGRGLGPRHGTRSRAKRPIPTRRQTPDAQAPAPQPKKRKPKPPPTVVAAPAPAPRQRAARARRRARSRRQRPVTLIALTLTRPRNPAGSSGRARLGHGLNRRRRNLRGRR